MNPPRPTAEDFKSSLLQNDRFALAKAITLVESTLPADQKIADELIDLIMPLTGKSIRIGITGVPGVGKSTFIESFGKIVTAEQKKIAVLAVDPSSQITRGSILGDKTRMDELSKDPLAFIRPSASGNTLGGVARNTRKAILLCEAAGFEVIVIETVGVGQSEVAVNNIVDFFLLLMLPGAGDELQGIKKGIMEMADLVVITKADGENMKSATRAQAEFQQALHLHATDSRAWNTRVLTCSALTGQGIAEVWKSINEHFVNARKSGDFDRRRLEQNIAWFEDHLAWLIKTDFEASHRLRDQREALIAKIRHAQLSPQKAAAEFFDAYKKQLRAGA